MRRSGRNGLLLLHVGDLDHADAVVVAARVVRGGLRAG
jgi:hypothetical protein